MFAMSDEKGTLRNIDVPLVSNSEAKIGSAAFFAPNKEMSPESGEELEIRRKERDIGHINHIQGFTNYSNQATFYHRALLWGNRKT